MRIPFFPIYMTSPLEGLLEHAEKVKECAWAFQQAIECYASEQCKTFQEYHQEVDKLESEADAIKRRIRGHIPLRVRMPVSKFQLFMYLNEQDKVCDSVEESLEWVSYRMIPGFPEELKKDLFLLVDAVIEPIEDLSRMVAEAIKYFDTYSDKQRNVVKGIIHNIRTREHEADGIKGEIKHKIFSMEKDPVGVLHGVKLAELISSIADHAENAGDMMRAIIAKKRGLFFKEKI